MIRFENFIIIKKIYDGVSDTFVNEEFEIEEVVMNLDNADEEFKSNTVDKFTFVVMRRMIIKNLRPKKINGYLKKSEDGYKQTRERSTISVIMNNGDIIIGTLAGKNVAISINDEIMYDVDKGDFTDSKFVDKISEQYIKYLKSKNYEVKRSN